MASAPTSDLLVYPSQVDQSNQTPQVDGQVGEGLPSLPKSNSDMITGDQLMSDEEITALFEPDIAPLDAWTSQCHTAGFHFTAPNREQAVAKACEFFAKYYPAEFALHGVTVRPEYQPLPKPKPPPDHRVLELIP